MNRLVLRILAVVFFTMLVASGLRMATFAHFFERFFFDPTWFPVRSTAALIVDIIDNTPLEKIEAEKNFLSAALNRRIDIVAMGDSTVSEDIRQRLSNGKLVYDHDRHTKGMFYAPVHHGKHLVIIDPSFQSYRPLIEPIDYCIAFIWVSVGAAIIGFLLALPLNRRLNKLEATVERIHRGDTAARTPFVAQDLVGSVEQHFNQMADRIQAMLLKQRSLLKIVVHKFQASVAQISGFMNVLARDNSPSDIRRRSQNIDNVIDELDQFVRDLLQRENKNASPGLAVTDEGKPPAAAKRQSALRTGIRKFFIRTSIGILIALSFNHLYGLFMSQVAYRNLSFDPDWYPLRTTAALIQRATNISGREMLPQRLEALQASLKNRIEFLPPGSEPAFSGSVKAASSNNITYGIYDGRGVFFAPVRSGTGTLIIDFDIRRYRVRPSLLSHLSAIPLEFVFIILGSMLLSLPIILDVKKLAAGIERIRQGDLTARVDVPLNRPIGKLAAGFNEMVDRVQSLLNQQQHLVQAVAHEVRTPVSRIRFHMEMLTDAESSPEADRRIADIMEEIKEMKQLTQELQTLAALDNPNEGYTNMAISLFDILAEIVAYLQKAHEQLDIVLMNTGEESDSVVAHPVYFKRAIQNLLSNAIRHAQKSVSIRYRSTKDGIFVDISDDGPGIPMDARKIVFDPFIRLDGSRNRNTGGFGLGLAIVKHIMHLHGGSVSIDNNIPQGTIMTTFWPHPPTPQPSAPVTN